MPKRWTRCQAGKAEKSFYSFLSHWKAEALYAQSFQNGYSIPETKRSSSNHEFRCSAYYDVKACKGHLLQFWNWEVSISITYNAPLSCLQFHFTTVFSLSSLPFTQCSAYDSMIKGTVARCDACASCDVTPPNSIVYKPIRCEYITR